MSMLGFSARIDNALATARYLYQRIEKVSCAPARGTSPMLTATIAMQDERFLVVAEPDYCNVCFWYLPKALRGISTCGG